MTTQHTRRTDTEPSLRPLMLLARAGAAGFILLVLALHVVSSEFDPVSRFVSEYVLGESPWLLRMAFLSVVVALLALTLLAHRALPPSRRRTVVTGLLGVSAIGTLVAGVFDADPKETPAGEVSTSSLIHYWAFMISVAASLTAMFLLWRLFARTPGWQAHARPQLLFAVVRLAAFLAMFASAEVVGLTQRVYLLVSLVWLAVAAGWLARAGQPASSPAEPTAGPASTQAALK